MNDDKANDANDHNYDQLPQESEDTAIQAETTKTKTKTTSSLPTKITVSKPLKLHLMGRALFSSFLFS
jgi:hypothetical protein